MTRIAQGSAGGELPERRERKALIEATDRWIGDWFGRCGERDLAWVCAPHLIIYVRAFGGAERVAIDPAPRRRAAALFAQLRGRPPRPSTVAGGYLFFSFSANQRRAQEPIAARLGRETLAPSDLDVPVNRETELLEQAVVLLDELLATARRQGFAPPVRRRALYQLVLRAARDLAWWETLLAAARPRGVVIGSTQSSAARALALAARRAGVPSTYVPHAPVLSDARLCDLPVDRAGLRGPAELDYYESCGAARVGMEAIGDPGLDEVDTAVELAGERPAFALPTDDAWVIERVIEFVAAALGEAVIASPHPRADRGAIRELLPHGWRVWEERTYELLRTGPPALIQFSSGTGLEALQLGIPTIDLAFPGEGPHYPFLREPHVSRVSTAAALRGALASARERHDPASREELHRWAARWVGAQGAGAAEGGVALLERAAREGTRPAFAWDAWRR